MTLQYKDPSTAHLKSIGEQFRIARERKGWTLEAASKATKIKVDRLLDLEENDFTNFDSPAYARGFVRIYAKNLGLNGSRVLGQLDGKLDDDTISPFIAAPSVDYVPERVIADPKIQGSRFGLKVILLVTAVFALLFGFLIYNAYQASLAREAEANQTATTNAGAPSDLISQPETRPLDGEAGVATAVPAQPETMESIVTRPQPEIAQPATAVGNANTLVLRAARTTYAKIEAQDGEAPMRVVFEGELEAGQEFTSRAELFEVNVAFGASVVIIWNGRNYGRLADSNAPVIATLPNQRIR